MLYIWTKTFHIVFVIAWMAAVFYLPRILVNLAEAEGQPEVRERLVLMGRRLYRFGHIMFGLAAVMGLVLWLYIKMGWGQYWVHAKLLLVALIFVYYMATGRMVKLAGEGKHLPSSRKLRLFNELPVLLLLTVVWLAVGKPF
ncbi:MAG: CopD family protein [Xanthomonadaceae bacterium]|jgi:putative membrane protein|nr:CopD family protein [Xanthomonadaceae bacterium]